MLKPLCFPSSCLEPFTARRSAIHRLNSTIAQTRILTLIRSATPRVYQSTHHMARSRAPPRNRHRRKKAATDPEVSPIPPQFHHRTPTQSTTSITAPPPCTQPLRYNTIANSSTKGRPKPNAVHPRTNDDNQPQTATNDDSRLTFELRVTHLLGTRLAPAPADAT